MEITMWPLDNLDFTKKIKINYSLLIEWGSMKLIVMQY